MHGEATAASTWHRCHGQRVGGPHMSIHEDGRGRESAIDTLQPHRGRMVNYRRLVVVARRTCNSNTNKLWLYASQWARKFKKVQANKTREIK